MRRRRPPGPRVVWVCVVLHVFGLECLWSCMPLVLDAGRRGSLGYGDARRVLLSPCLGVPTRLWRLTLAVSRANSRSEARAEAVGVGSSALFK